MIITNLTAEPYAYQINVRLIEQCLSAGPDHFKCPEMQELTKKGAYNMLATDLPIAFHCDGSIINMTRINIVSMIPIYLVTKAQSMKELTVSYFGHKEEVTVPMEIYPYELPATVNDVLESISSGQYNRSKEVADLYGGNHDENTITSSCIDYFGLYVRKSPNNGTYSIDQSHPRIFIWVDRIYEYVHGDRHKYEIVTTLSILHELAHAMMDINLTGSISNMKEINHDAFFYLKEESLAEAIALTLIKPHITEDDWLFVVSLKQGRPFEYALGLEYLDKSGDFVMKSVGEWLRVKETGQYSQIISELWIKYIYSYKHHDFGQLELLDRGMRYPEVLCRYPATSGRFYRTLTAPVKIIKDYVKANPMTTRAQLHEIFPYHINYHFEPIVNYPERQHFKFKEGNGTRPVSHDSIVDCSDGKVAVCDYWHPLMMDKFISCAAQLGINVEMFYTPDMQEETNN